MATVQHGINLLEFHQAMADFKVMFPTMDKDVIEAVLRSNHGAVDSTIDNLLSMITDNENEQIRYKLDRNEAIEAFSISEATVVLSQEEEDCGGKDNSTPLHKRRGWCPPLLCPLPDNFLRIVPEPLESKQLEGDLEEERFGVFLQNDEFMAELRWNKDFLSMLDRDSPTKSEAGFLQSRSSDEDAIFKERLRNMGKMSRKKFSQLAKVFTGRMKRNSSNKIRDNLLLHDEDSDGT